MRNTKTNWIAISLGAVGTGAGLMYLLDPKRGRERRSFIGEKALHAAKVASREFQGSGRDLTNRARGFAIETTSRLAEENVPDEVLVERVRSKIGRVLSHPKAVGISAENGIVDLSGGVLRSQMRRAIGCAESVRGVRAVRHDTLRTYADERGIPGFEQRGGKKAPLRDQRELRQQRKPSRKMRALRMGIAIGSAAVAAYRALTKDVQPRTQDAKPSTASDIAA